MTRWHKISDRNWGFVSKLRLHHLFWGLYIVLVLWFILSIVGCVGTKAYTRTYDWRTMVAGEYPY